ncbi:MAG: DEAD/DEAH box helicase [Deltaproteobacteria bacterium]|nr:DEAD/DEAH box helicase [Deltaproteobacteria bacterium]
MALPHPKRESGCRPIARLFADSVMVDQGTPFLPKPTWVKAPLIALSFDYEGTEVRASDPMRRVFASTAHGAMSIDREQSAENHARAVLESLGATELECLEHYTAPASADYLIQPDGDAHTLCAFTAYAVPQLQRLGWRVTIDPDYPWQVVNEGQWYADVDDTRDGGREQSTWFSLELGIELDGQRINLLPPLLDMLDRASSLRALLNRRKCIAVPIDEKRYVAIKPQRMRILLDVLLELYEGPQQDARLHFSEYAAAGLLRLDEIFGDNAQSLSWSDGAGVRQRAQTRSAVQSIRAPSGLFATLRPYQQEGLEWLQHLRCQDLGGILADDMGLGKTLQTIAHLLCEHSGRAEHPSLVVAPTSLVYNWQREIAKFAPSLRTCAFVGNRRHRLYPRLDRYDVVLTSYPLLVRDLDQLKEQSFHLLILDEAQTIKNSRSQTRRAAVALDAQHRLCLSGTPLENNLGELWSLFDFVMPGMLGSAADFRERFRAPIEKNQDSARLGVLRQRVAPYILRRIKEEVARDLPPKTEIVRPVELRGDQRELYESIRLAAHDHVRAIIAQRGISRSTIAVLDALMKLRQVCCDPRLVKVGAARQIANTAKLDLLMEMVPLQLQQGRRILIFSQFTTMLKLIGRELSDAGINYVSLTGATADRQAQVDAFQNGVVDVFLISLKAGGTGLNLTRADTVIHYDPWWNPAAQSQATDRAYRIGQKRPVFVYKLIVAGSVEERMLQLQQQKQRLADGILAGTQTALDDETIDTLFAPLGG